jgi:hypothetical protein
MYYLLCTPHLPPSKSEKNILKDADRNNIQVQILPLRIEDRESCDKLIGEKWDFLKDKHVGQSKILTEGNDSSYIYLEGNLVVKKIHPEWKKLIGDNRGKIKMCHHDDSILYCGGCSLKGGGIFPNWKLSSNE